MMTVAVRWQKLEGLAVFIAGLLAYDRLDGNWWVFLGLFLAPDLSMLAYAINARVGAFAYNLAHSLTLPLVLMATGFALSHQACVLGALIWISHIGFDRALGYGLKSPLGFGLTSMGRIGKAARAEQ